MHDKNVGITEMHEKTYGLNVVGFLFYFNLFQFGNNFFNFEYAIQVGRHFF